MIKTVRAGRGGKRVGAGRHSKWRIRSGFKSIRVPIPLAAQLLEIARYLDGQQYFRAFHSFEDEESQDFNGAKAMEFAYLHHCAEILGIQNNELQREVENLKAQLKSAKKQKLKVL